MGRFFGKTEMLKHIKIVHEKVKDHRYEIINFKPYHTYTTVCIRGLDPII